MLYDHILRELRVIPPDLYPQVAYGDVDDSEGIGVTNLQSSRWASQQARELSVGQIVGRNFHRDPNLGLRQGVVGPQAGLRVKNGDAQARPSCLHRPAARQGRRVEARGLVERHEQPPVEGSAPGLLSSMTRQGNATFGDEMTSG